MKRITAIGVGKTCLTSRGEGLGELVIVIGEVVGCALLVSLPFTCTSVPSSCTPSSHRLSSWLLSVETPLTTVSWTSSSYSLLASRDATILEHPLFWVREDSLKVSVSSTVIEKLPLPRVQEKEGCTRPPASRLLSFHSSTNEQNEVRILLEVYKVS